MNSKNWSWPSFSPFSTPNLQCHPKAKLCPSKNYTTFILGDFGVFRWNSENAAKVPEGVQRHRGLTGFLTKGWPQVGFDLIKRIIRDCWLGFRGDDPGGPRFDPCQQCLTWLIRPLALMMLIKNLGRHSCASFNDILLLRHSMILTTLPRNGFVDSTTCFYAPFVSSGLT
jgi:hypothetical protein